MAHLVVQASGAMLEGRAGGADRKGSAFLFATYVTDQDGAPVTGLKRASFSVWEIGSFTERNVTVMEPQAAFKLPGVYRLQTSFTLPASARIPQEFVFAIRVHKAGKVRSILQGTATAAITFLGESH